MTIDEFARLNKEQLLAVVGYKMLERAARNKIHRNGFTLALIIAMPILIGRVFGQREAGQLPALLELAISPTATYIFAAVMTVLFILMTVTQIRQLHASDKYIDELGINRKDIQNISLEQAIMAVAEPLE